jgi:MFS family permease
MTLFKNDTFKLLLGSVISLVLLMGLARFTYTIALPKMQSTLGMGDDTAGWLAAANFSGYLSGALIGSRLSSANVRLHFFRVSLVLAIICNALMPLFEHVALWSVLRFISGMASAGGMVVGTSLVLSTLQQSGKQSLIGVHFGGVGLGITLTALVLGSKSFALSWQEVWFTSATLGLICLLPPLLWVKLPVKAMQAKQGLKDDNIDLIAFGILLLSYLFTGATFSIETTFIVAVFESNPLLNGSAQKAWLFVGLAAAPSCYFWVKFAGRFGNTGSILFATLLQTIGCILPVIVSTPAAALIGSLLFGFTFMGIVAVVLALAGQLSHGNPARYMGLLVVSYGVGQIAGPVVSGIWMEHNSNPNTAIWLATGFSAISGLILLCSLIPYKKIQRPMSGLQNN